MDEMSDAQRAAALALEQELLSSIPLTRAMQLKVTAYAGDRLQICAPLAPISTTRAALSAAVWPG